MPLAELLVCTLSKHGRTVETELRRYAEERGEKTVRITKQGYLQQSRRLNPEIFRYLNHDYLQSFYQSQTEARTWNGHLVLAIDGSKAQENQKEFGRYGNQHTKGGPIRAQVSCIYDTLNDLCLDMQIGAISESESEQAKSGLEQIRQITGKYPSILLFDRGFPSIEFMDYLERSGYSYLFRLSFNDYKKERQSMVGPDAVVELKHTGPRLQKIGRRHPERPEELRRKGRTCVRIIQCSRSGQAPLVLMTNLPLEQYAAEDLEALYRKRWGSSRPFTP